MACHAAGYLRRCPAPRKIEKHFSAASHCYQSHPAEALPDAPVKKLGYMPCASALSLDRRRPRDHTKPLPVTPSPVVRLVFVRVHHLRPSFWKFAPHHQQRYMQQGSYCQGVLKTTMPHLRYGVPKWNPLDRQEFASLTRHTRATAFAPIAATGPLPLTNEGV